MDARTIRTVLGTALLLLVSMGARYRSANFIIETDDPRFAQACGEAAEKYRHDLAVEWLGQAMPNWSAPCPVTILVGPNLGAGGQTSFVFDRGEVFGWRMSIQGSPQRLLDSVIPHEVTHMIFASHFREPLPRWADEGGATSVEHVSERNKHRQMLDQFLRTGRGISFSRMFAMTEYPPDVMPLYAQGYSVVEYLIQHGGRRKYIKFLEDGLNSGDWSGALRRSYGAADLGQFQNNWLAWIKQGSPIHRPPGGPTAGDASIMLASNPPRGAAGLSGSAGSTVRQANPGTQIASSDIKLAGQLVPVPNPLLRNLPRSNPNALAQASAPGSSVYAPRFSPLPAGEGQGVRAELTKNSSPHPSPLPKGEGTFGIDPNNQFAAAPAVLSADGWRPCGSSALASASAPPPNASTLNTTQVTRPQPVEGPKQIILEWNAR
ncbi:MAG: hypothetical protein JXB10_08370 [Pirellulales bacterium]|nr:hypothetical protein [Pirellulales bacterium]